MHHHLDDEDYQEALRIRRRVAREAESADEGTRDGRAWRMAHDYLSGDSLQMVGERFGITRERVRQVLNSLVGFETPRLRQVKQVLEDAEQKSREQELVRLARQWSEAHPGAHLDAAAEALGVSERKVKKALGPRARLHYRRTSTSKPRWSDEQLLELIRRYHRETGLTTSAGFTEWTGARGGPTHQTPVHRFGSWADAAKRAGLTGVIRVERERTHRDEDLWAAVITFVGEERPAYSFAAFQDFAAAVPGMPSGSLVRVRLNIGWEQMIRTARRVLSADAHGMDPQWVRDVLEPRDWSVFLAAQGPDWRSVIELAIEDLGPYLTINGYDEWAIEHGQPRSATLIRRSALPWYRMVRACGGRTGSPKPQTFLPDAEVYAGLCEFIAGGNAPLYEEYSRWASSRSVLSAKLVSQRAGGWRRAVQKARALLS